MKSLINVIIGDNERDNNLVSFRRYGSEENCSMSISDFVKLMHDEIKVKYNTYL